MIKGHIEVIAGSMFSGKTHELIRRLRLCVLARKKVQVFKSFRDDRYKKQFLVSHDGFEIESVAAESAREILERLNLNTQVVGIDEAQFFDQGLIEVCEEMARRGIRVIAAGLDLDWRAQPFEVMAELLARAELVTKNLAICSVCGEDAHYSFRLLQSQEERVVVGARDLYEARCRQCFDAGAAAEPPQEALAATR